MPAPQAVVELVERFRQVAERGDYNEAQLRQEFIAPFFNALGWDVANERGASEAYKDVIHEAAVRMGGGTKAPDYCFRIAATRRFFVEAKRSSVDIAEAPEPAYQLRRYAWSARLPMSILTSFRLEHLVDHMLALVVRLEVTRVPHEQEAVRRPIAATDEQIDRLVYELYGLSGEEIRIVEQP